MTLGSLADVASAIHAAAPWGAEWTPVGGVSTDSRTAGPGDLFFALRGPNFDGHMYVADALRRGACAAVVSWTTAAVVANTLAAQGMCGPALLHVADPQAALAALAAWRRVRLAAQVIAVIGSNGKTTTKELLAHVLACRRRGRASPKSFNNAIGVPVTLLSARDDDEFLVVEIGTNAPGEIEALGLIAQPDVALLTSIGEEHLEGLRDLAGVATEECSILRTLRPGGFVAANVDSPLVEPHLRGAGVAATTFGFAAHADARVSDVRYEPPWLRFRVRDRGEYRLPLPGAHHASNAAGVIAIAERMGVSRAEIAARFATFVPPPMRTEVLHAGGVTLINDAYNANPASVAAALAMLADYPCRGRRVLVLGAMRELGDQTVALHDELARQVAAAPVELVVLVGDAVPWMYDRIAGARVDGAEALVGVSTPVEAAAVLAARLCEGDVVLLKASRSVALEALVEPLKAKLTPAPAASTSS
ncbi:MAG: UDP-N-acetylmuramoyl-tripeptide--D-alanyl-D-alanine ligase [Phycisphaerae bacterium]